MPRGVYPRRKKKALVLVENKPNKDRFMAELIKLANTQLHALAMTIQVLNQQLERE